MAKHTRTLHLLQRQLMLFQEVLLRLLHRYPNLLRPLVFFSEHPVSFSLLLFPPRLPLPPLLSILLWLLLMGVVFFFPCQLLPGLIVYLSQVFLWSKLLVYFLRFLFTHPFDVLWYQRHFHVQLPCDFQLQLHFIPLDLKVPKEHLRQLHSF